MDIKELRAKAKEAGIKSYWNKKEAKLIEELAALESSDDFDLTIDERAMPFLRRVSFNKDKLIAAAKHQKADKVVYDLRYRTFDLYNNNKKFDTLPIGSF